jgi:hypothetical protein
MLYLIKIRVVRFCINSYVINSYQMTSLCPIFFISNRSKILSQMSDSHKLNSTKIIISPVKIIIVSGHPTNAAKIRPWLMNQATPFWILLNKLEDFVNISMKFEIGNGEKIIFWLDNWQGTILKWEYRVLFTFVQDTNISIAES